MDRIERDFHRTMADIERERASINIDSNLGQLEKELKEARKAVKDYEKEVEKAENNRSRAQKRRHLETLRQTEDEKRAKLETAKAAAAASKEETKAAKLAQKEVDAAIKREEQRARVFERTHQQYMKNLATEARRRGALADQRTREFTRAEKEAHAMERSRQRELDAIPKLQRSYAELESRLVKLAAARRRARGDRQAVQIIDLKEQETVADMHRLHDHLKRIGAEPISIHVDLDRGTRSGRFIHDALRSGGIREAAHAAGIAAGVSMGSGLERGMRRVFSRGILTDLGNATARGFSRIGSLFDNLSNMTVRLGPFTATIRQLAAAMTILAPIIVDVVGALGSMVSVAGAATLGIGALGVGLAGGALPALVGVVSVVKPMVAEFKSLVTLSKGYNDAVLKYGKSSDQAKAKLQQMNHALGGVDEQTRRAFRSAGTLSDRWARLTDDSRAAAFHIMGRGLEFLNGGLKEFGRNTNETFAAVQKATDRWFDGLESAEGRHILDTMWDNFNDSLGPALDGLGNVVTYLGRVGAIASGFLPGLARGFRDWSQGLADSAADAGDLADRIDKVMDATRSFGQFLVSGGRLLKTFFAGGVGPGVSMLDTMTAALNRWNATLQTTQGQAGLADFFERSVSGAQALYGAIAPLISTFTAWASALSPVSAGIFRVVGAISSIVGAITRLTVLQGPLQALGATLATIWAVGKIGAASTAIGNFSKALFGLSRATAAVAATETVAAAATTRIAATGAVAQGAMAATGAAAVRSGAQVGVLRGAAQTLVPAIAGMGAVAGGLATAGLTVLAGAAAYGIYKLATMKSETEKLNEEFANATDRSMNAGKAFKVAEAGLDDAGGAMQRAQLNLKLTRERLQEAKKGTDEYKLAMLDYRDAQRQANDTQAQFRSVARNYIKDAHEQNQADIKRQQVAREIVKTQEELLRQQKRRAAGEIVAPQAIDTLKDKLRDLRGQYAGLDAQVEAAQNRQATAFLNVKRAAQNLMPVVGQAQQQLGALARQSRGVAARIALKFDAPKDVGRVAAQASRALKAGVQTRIVTKIVADSRSAEQAIRRINAVKLAAKNLDIIERGGPRAIAVLERIKGTKLSKKQQEIAERGGPEVMAMLERIIRRRINNKSFSINAIDNASGTVSGIISQINAIPASRDVYIRAHYSSSGSLHPGMNATGGLSQGFASGGETGSSPNKVRIQRAVAEASGRRTRDIRGGGVVSRPTYLTGEENRREIVISTNPAYRRRNLGYLRMAARQLGADDGNGTVISAAAGMGLSYGSGSFGGEQGYKPAEGIVPRPKKKAKRKGGKKAKRKYKLAAGRGWAKYMDGLKVQASDWEREVGIREGNVREPADLVIKTGEKELADGTKIDVFSENTSAINTYKADLAKVVEAYDHLKLIMQTFIQAVPVARQQLDIEADARRTKSDELRKAIHKHEATLNNDKSSKEQKKKAKKQLGEKKAALAHEQAILADIKEDRNTLSEDAKDFGFDIRENARPRDEAQAEIDSVEGRAKTEATERNEQETGGGGSGGGGAPSGAVQESLANAAKAEVLQQFAGNFAALGATPGGLGGPGSGSLANLATNPAIVGAAIGGAIGAGGGSLGGGSAASIISAGSTAGGLVATSPTVAGAGQATAAPAAGGDTNVTVINNFEEQPADPHTWSANTAFELGALMS